MGDVDKVATKMALHFRTRSILSNLVASARPTQSQQVIWEVHSGMVRRATRADRIRGDAEAESIRRRTRLENDDDDDVVERKSRKWKTARAQCSCLLVDGMCRFDMNRAEPLPSRCAAPSSLEACIPKCKGVCSQIAVQMHGSFDQWKVSTGSRDVTRSR